MRFFKPGESRPTAEDEAAASRLAALASRTKAQTSSCLGSPYLDEASLIVGRLAHG